MRIFAPEAWKIQSTSPDVVVAVIDSGIRTTHEDLRNNIWINPHEISGNGIDDDRNGYVDDVNGWNFLKILIAGIHRHMAPMLQALEQLKVIILVVLLVLHGMHS